MANFVNNNKWMDETNNIPSLPNQPTPVWDPSDDLSRLVIVPLEETDHKLLSDTYIHFTTKETRGISKKVTVEYKNVTKVRYQFCVHDNLSTGNPGGYTGWNIMSDLDVEISTSGVSCFHIMDKIVPLTKTIFKKNVLNDSPFPSCNIAWYKVNQLPEVHVELNEPGDVKISYDKIYTPLELGGQIVTRRTMLIPLENYFLQFHGGFVELKDDKKRS